MAQKFLVKINKGKIEPYNREDFYYKIAKLEGKDIYITFDSTKKRTIKQNRAIHLFCQLLADELNNTGMDMKAFLKKGVDIMWTTQSVKDYIWRPIQKALLQKKSTTQLKTNEVDRVYEIINKHLGEKGIYVPFPSLDEPFN